MTGKLLLLVAATSAFAADITTRDGTTYQNAKVTGVDPDGIRVLHSDGVAKVPLRSYRTQFRSSITGVSRQA